MTTTARGVPTVRASAWSAIQASTYRVTIATTVLQDAALALPIATAPVASLATAGALALAVAPAPAIRAHPR